MDYPSTLQQWLSGVQKVFPAADTVVVAGPEERHFAAHRAILASHSGYLKNLVTNCAPDTNTLHLPSVGSDSFDVLLAFMYSGYLNVHQHNIYSVLSAAHILHMPTALELCREFLVKVEQYDLACKQTAALTFIFKPVATRKPLPCMLKKSDSVHISHNVILRSSESLFKSVTGGAAGAVDDAEASTSTADQPPKQQTLQISVLEAVKEDDSKAGRVILDIACCDGPVRFHRVLNDEYGTEIVSATPERVDCDSDDENTMDHDEGKSKQSGKDSGGESTYKCLYCNHTFKSQYCYQKHTRRHINPVTYDVLKLTANLKDEMPRTKLLDMNVQYYPCKSCGSKFPSYYFVHKHRKLCHPGEAELDKEPPPPPPPPPPHKKSFKAN